MRKPTNFQRLLREKTLYRYLLAVENVDLATIEQIWQQATHDELLEYMLLEAHEVYLKQETSALQEEIPMDFKEGVHKSLPQEELDELQAIQDTPASQPSRYTRWLQVLAAIVLIALLSGGVLLYTRLHSSGSRTASSSLYRWCTSPGATLDPVSLPQFNSIAAAAPNDVWLVGQNQLQTQNPPLLEHWNGQSWSVFHDQVPTDEDGSLNSVDVLSANDAWAAGYVLMEPTQANGEVSFQHILLEHWNGQQWQMLPNLNISGPANIQSWLGTVSATSDNNVWAVGGTSIPAHGATPFTSSQNLIVHWDGSHWSVSQPPAFMRDATLTSIKAFAPDDVWVTGFAGQGVTTGTPLLAHWDGQNWTTATLPSNLSSMSGVFADLTALAPNDLWAIGSSYRGQNPTNAAPIILHWNGSQWTQMSTPTAANYSIYVGGLAATATNSLWIVGRMYGNTQHGPTQMFVAQWNGRGWTMRLQQTAGNKALTDIAVAGTKIWVIGATYQSGSNSNAYTILNPFIETNC